MKCICEQVDIGKTTFYAHFEDKYGIIQWYSDLCFGLGVANIGRTLTWHEGHPISTTGHYERREANLIETLRDYKHVEVTQQVYFQVVALAAAETAAFRRALAQEDPPTVEELTEILMDIVPRELFGLLEEPALPDGAPDELLMRMMLVSLMLSTPGRTAGRAASARCSRVSDVGR